MNYKKIIDISWPISQNMTAYKDRKVVAVTHTKTWEADKAREALITLGTHTGTHVDAPPHFMQNGPTIDQLDLAKLVGSCTVFDMTHVDDFIDAHDLKDLLILEDQIILFKTKNSALDHNTLFNPQFIYLNASGAQFLADKKVRAVGIDYLGIERGQPGHETHLRLLEKDIPIIEGLRLGHVQAGEYFFCCLPLTLAGLEAAPARAILMQE
jgi:arylformamidase